MESETILIATGSMLLPIAVVAACGWFCYRVLRRRPARIRTDSQSYYAAERWRSTRHQH